MTHCVLMHELRQFIVASLLTLEKSVTGDFEEAQNTHTMVTYLQAQTLHYGKKI